MSDQDLDLRASFGVIRSRRLLIGFIALVGLAAGLAYGVAKPVMPAATALVLLPTTTVAQPEGTPTSDVATQIAIATSVPLLAKAGSTVTPPLSGFALRHRVHVSAESGNVFAIRAADPSQAVAQRLANAIAADYIDYVTTAGSSATAGDVAALASQANQLTGQLKTIQGQIATLSKRVTSNASSKQQEATLLSTLQGEQTAVTLQLNSVDSQIVDSRLNGALATGTIRVLQPAAPDSTSSLRLPMLAGIGAAIGLLIGVIAALMHGRRNERLVRRNQIAAAIGSPVLASLGADPCKNVKDWHHLLEKYRPVVRDAWNLQRILRYFDRQSFETRTTLYVLSIADDRAALTVGPRLATYAASRGDSTALVCASHPSATLLRAACEAEHRQERSDQLRTYSAPEARTAAVAEVLTIITTVVARNEPVVDIPEGSIVILALSSGFATADDLARVALAASDTRVTVEGVIVVNPDTDDPTTGESSKPASRRRFIPRPEAFGSESAAKR